MQYMVLFWCILALVFKYSVARFEPLGAVLALSWGVLGAPGAVLDPTWAVLGSSWGPLGPSWGSLVASWCVLQRLEVENGKPPKSFKNYLKN